MSKRIIELSADDIRWQPEKVIELLANLARRVASLERQLADTQRNVEMLGAELAGLRYLAERGGADE